MAVYTTIDDPGLYFNTVLYVGNQPSSNPITGVGFQPDFIWVKDRDATPNHVLFTSVQGLGQSFYSNSNAAAVTDANGITAFGADGFTVADWSQPNTAADDYVSFNWKAGTTSGIDTTGATITPTGYSFNQTSGFSILQYDGNGVQGATVAHGLGAAPEFIMVKATDATESWPVGHAYMNSSSPWDYYAYLNTTAAAASDSAYYADVSPTSTVFSVGNNSSINSASNTYIAYCFAPKKGYSKFGSYLGNGDADGTYVYTGFRPAYVMNKRTNSTAAWKIHNNKVPLSRGNVCNLGLSANTTAAESAVDGPDRQLDFLSNGFKWRATDTDVNNSGSTYIYMAFAESPLVNSEGVPSNSR
jgi:hypothetical protein